MTSSGSFNTTGYQGRYLTFEWYVQSQDIVSNTTVIAWSLKGAGNAESSYYYTQNIKVTINGATVYNKPKSEGQVVLYNGTVVATGTYTFTHNAEGNYSFSAYAEAGIYTWAVNCTGSESFSLPQIPRVSVPTLSANSVYFGSNITIYTNRKASSFTHHLYYSINGDDEVAITDGIGASYTWTVPYDLMSNIPSGTSATIMFRLYTFNGGTNIGNNTISFTANAPNNSTTKPEVSMALSPVSSLASAFSGLYIQGKTKVKAALSAIGKYDASIESYSMTAEGVSYGSADSYTSGFLSQYGSITVTGYATDSRNFTGNTSEAITVIAYSKPSISARAYRCDASGNKSDTGTYLKISATRSYAKVMSGSTQKNFCLIRFRYKASGAASYSAWTTILAKDSLSSDSVTTSALLSGALSVASSYSVQVQAVDDIGETALTEMHIATETVHTHKAKNSLGLGKYSEKENTLDMGWDIELNGNKVLNNGVEAYFPASRLAGGLYTSGFTIASGASKRFRINAAFLMYGRMNANASAMAVYGLSAYSEYRYPVIAELNAGTNITVSSGGDNSAGWYVEVTNNSATTASLYLIGSGIPNYLN